MDAFALNIGQCGGRGDPASRGKCLVEGSIDLPFRGIDADIPECGNTANAYRSSGMTDQGAYGTRLGQAFGMNEAPVVIAGALDKFTKSLTAVTEIGCPRDWGRTAQIPREDAYLVGLQLRACHDHDLYLDGRRIRPTNFFGGVTSIYDLRRDPIWDLRDPFYCRMLYLPRQALDSVANEAGAPKIANLCDQPGVGINDPVVRSLLASLFLTTTKPRKSSSLFQDYVLRALTVHIAQVYGGMHAIQRIPRGALAPWQERRAKELMRTSLTEELPLSRLAAECGLSVRHFARAFRQSTGMPPHRWLLKQRIERATDLLHNRVLPLADIAISCGFADQSHFTRVFTALVGVSPSAWRRSLGVTEALMASARAGCRLS
jgi:AraC-like DNA-binding protein